ncbi:MAG: ABC transporter permease, partial [Planctomycetes bacterium]|nr:ABC transporter permease [Planctomycetota bacterium]
VYFTGVQALPMLSVLAASIGMATILGALVALPAIGAADYLGITVVIVIIRELAPIVTAVIVIARSGTAMAAELASMSIEDEINAMKAMKINHIRLVVLPRLFGCIVSVLCLTAYFACIAILSGYAAASLTMDYPLDTFLIDVVAAIRPIDIIASFLKCLVFGTIVPLLSCYYGLSAEYSSTHIPRMTTKATIRSLVWCFIGGFVITLLTY